MVAILGHLDVVPLGDGWTKNPLGEISGERLYGRGVVDDKGPTIASIYALKAIDELKIRINKRIRVIYGTDEESGFDCVHHYINSGQELPVAGFTPDADYPVIFAEKGNIGLSISKKISDNGDFELIGLSGGVAKNVVMPSVDIRYRSNKIIPDSQTTGENIFYLTVYGKPAHASTPDQGVNALMLLCKALSNMDIQGDFSDLVRFINSEFNLEPNGKSMGVFYSDNESGEITLSIGLVRFTEGTVSFTVDIRYPVTMDPDPCIAMIRKKAEAYGLDVELLSTKKPHHVPKDSPLIKTLMSVYKEKTGDISEPVAIGGGTYAKAFKNMVAFGIEFPGEPLAIHQADESVRIDSLIKSTKISAEAIVRLANENFDI